MPKFLHPLLMAGFGMLVVSLLFYPGTMNNDSLWQLDQALKNEYFDGHPPIMSYLWHFLIFSKNSGGASMFLFCLLMYSTAITFIAYAEFESNRKRWVFIIFSFLFPPLLLILGFIIKDSLMTVSLLLAYSLMLYANLKKSKVFLIVSLMFLDKILFLAKILEFSSNEHF